MVKNKLFSISIVFIMMLALVFIGGVDNYTESYSCGPGHPLVEPEYNPGGSGNPEIEDFMDVGGDCIISRLNFESGTSLRGNIVVNGYTIHYEVYGDNDEYFMFEVNGDYNVVKAIIIKGGPNAYLYDYTELPEYQVSYDCNLTSPDHPEPGVKPAVSHFEILVCPPPKGYLQVNKSWIDDESLESYRPEDVVVDIYSDDDNSHAGTITLLPDSGADDNQWSGVLCGLPIGDYYVVENDVPNYTTEYPDGNSVTIYPGDCPEEATTANNTFGTMAITEPEDPEPAVIEIKNTLEKGSLIINKEFNYDDIKGYTFDINQIKVEVAGPSFSSPQTYTIPIDKNGNGSIPINDLIPGTYTVTEPSLGTEWSI
ncbi:MAG: Cna B-type domain-containing protein, partial [Bacillota bacterium]